MLGDEGAELPPGRFDGCVAIGLSVLEHVPDEHDELAGKRGDGDVVALLAPNAIEGGRDGGWAPCEHLGSFDGEGTGVSRAGLGDSSMVAVSRGLADPRDQAEVGSQLPGRGEAPDVADGGEQTQGDGDADAWDRHQQVSLLFDGRCIQQLLMAFQACLFQFRNSFRRLPAASMALSGWPNRSRYT